MPCSVQVTAVHVLIVTSLERNEYVGEVCVSMFAVAVVAHAALAAGADAPVAAASAIAAPTLTRIFPRT
jgi:hypothetical protein